MVQATRGYASVTARFHLSHNGRAIYGASRVGDFSEDAVKEIAAAVDDYLRAQRRPTTHFEVHASPKADGTVTISSKGDGLLEAGQIEALTESIRQMRGR